MENKRGVSHIEAVISFVIFIGFLIFAYFFFSPFESDRTLDSTLEYAYREVKDHTQMQTLIYSLKVTDPSVNGLVSARPNSLLLPNVSIENSQGNIIDSSVDSSNNVHFTLPSDDFVKIKYAPYITNGQSGAGGQPLTDTQYIISSYEEKDYYSIQRLINLSEDYKSDYIGLKKKFNLPNRVDFDFMVTLNNASIIKAEQNMPDNIEIKANQDRIELMHSNGSINFADLVVRVW